MNDPQRRHTASRSAIAMAKASAAGDLKRVYEIWARSDPTERADLIAALAHLPVAVMQAVGADPTDELERMSLIAASEEN